MVTLTTSKGALSEGFGGFLPIPLIHRHMDDNLRRRLEAADVDVRASEEAIEEVIEEVRSLEDGRGEQTAAVLRALLRG